MQEQQATVGPGLQRRLLLLLLAPLLILAALNTWFDFQLADTAAIQQDRQLLTMVPQLADSIHARGAWPPQTPDLHMAAEIDDFLATRQGRSAYAVLNADGKVLLGETWLGDYPPNTYEPEFSSVEHQGVVYRIVSQRIIGSPGELTVRLADGSDVRIQWYQRLWFRVILPNLVLAVGAAFAVNWAVRRALRPLLQLKDAVEGRSPRDLTPLDASGSPDEVRPLAGLQAQVEAWAMPEGQSVTLGPTQLRKLRDATRRTSQLANQLLALSRADARSTASEPRQAVDLKALCEEVLEDFLDAAAAKQIDLGLEVSEVRVSGFAWLLRELLVNLVDNAVRYTQAGGRVTLRTGQTRDPIKAGAWAFLEVEDDGPGVPLQERMRMCERFYRLPGTPGEGNGLGLAIAEEIAHVHNSQLQINAGAQGKGLRCTLLLEAVRE